MNVVDTSGWIEYFFSGPNANYFAKPIERTKDLLVPTLCLYEVFKKVTIVSDEAKALQVVAQMRRAKVVDLTEDIALSAALISLQYHIPMADSMIYATAKTHRAILWTQNEDFKNLPQVHYQAHH